MKHNKAAGCPPCRIGGFSGQGSRRDAGFNRFPALFPKKPGSVQRLASCLLGISI
jgi:hypothetical protein